MKSLNGTIPPLRRIRLPARIKKGHASRGYEFMDEKKICASDSKDIPMEYSAIMLDPNANAIASGAPLRNKMTINAMPIYINRSKPASRRINLFGIDTV
jgi:hypothetical protein